MSTIVPRIDHPLAPDSGLLALENDAAIDLAALPTDPSADLVLPDWAAFDDLMTRHLLNGDAATSEDGWSEAIAIAPELAVIEPSAESSAASEAIDPLTGQLLDEFDYSDRLPPDFQFPPGSPGFPDAPDEPDAPGEPDTDPEEPDTDFETPDTDPVAGFDPLTGYGLIDAAAAVGAALGTPIDTEVPDLGGVNWGNDLINAPEVWAEGITGAGVVVAVIDSGTDITHPDLAPNLWTNEAEILGDGIDNDGNGFTDDIYGWNFEAGQSDNLVLPGTTNPGQDHGTHVAGIIAAENDGVGMTGVAHDAEIMSIRLGDVGPGPGGAAVFLNSGNLADAIYYAVDNGADVINMSLGTFPSQELEDALAYAASQNVFVVSAAGNSGAIAPGAPASYAVDYGASVGAVDSNGDLAFFSNGAGFDSAIQHVTAPGVDVYSTLPNGGYGEKSGTSMAAPYVAGVVALMKQANPNLTVEEIGNILTKNNGIQASPF